MNKKSKKQIEQETLTEAKKRRETQQKKNNENKEINGPKGPEPTRYGDWENNGIARDF